MNAIDHPSLGLPQISQFNARTMPADVGQVCHGDLQ